MERRKGEQISGLKWSELLAVGLAPAMKNVTEIEMRGIVFTKLSKTISLWLVAAVIQ